MHSDASEFVLVSIEPDFDNVFVLFIESVLPELLDESEDDVYDEELETFVIADSSDSLPESPSDSGATSSYCSI